MEQPDAEMNSEIGTFHSAASLVDFTTSGLAASTMVDHPFTLLMHFKDTCKEITIENIQMILTLLSSANALRRLEMQYFHVTGDEQDIPNPVMLNRVTDLRLRCKMVVDAVTMPVLEGLFVEPGFIGWTDFADADLEPDTLFSVLNLLQWSQCQNTLQEIELGKVPLTAHILDVLQLCLALDMIQLTFQYWQRLMDAAFEALLRELKWTKDNGYLACAPILTLVMLHIE